MFLYIWLQRKRERNSIAQREAAKEAGLTEPASLHPVIDPSRCLGSGACVTACPSGALVYREINQEGREKRQTVQAQLLTPTAE